MGLTIVAMIGKVRSHMAIFTINHLNMRNIELSVYCAWSLIYKTTI